MATNPTLAELEETQDLAIKLRHELHKQLGTRSYYRTTVHHRWNAVDLALSQMVAELDEPIGRLRRLEREYAA